MGNDSHTLDLPSGNCLDIRSSELEIPEKRTWFLPSHPFPLSTTLSPGNSVRLAFNGGGCFMVDYQTFVSPCSSTGQSMTFLPSGLGIRVPPGVFVNRFSEVALERHPIMSDEWRIVFNPSDD